MDEPTSPGKALVDSKEPLDFPFDTQLLDSALFEDGPAAATASEGRSLMTNQNTASVSTSHFKTPPHSPPSAPQHKTQMVTVGNVMVNKAWNWFEHVKRNILGDCRLFIKPTQMSAWTEHAVTSTNVKTIRGRIEQCQSKKNDNECVTQWEATDVQSLDLNWLQSEHVNNETTKQLLHEAADQCNSILLATQKRNSNKRTRMLTTLPIWITTINPPRALFPQWPRLQNGSRQLLMQQCVGIPWLPVLAPLPILPFQCQDYA